MEGREVAEIAAAFGLLAGYHVFVLWRAPRGTIQAYAARARSAWVASIVGDPQRSVLGVQTFRNLIMSATFLASTSILLAIGMLGVLVSADELPDALTAFSVVSRTSLEAFAGKTLVLVGNFFLVFLNFSLVVRYYSHCSIMINADDGPGHVDMVAGLMERGARHHTLGMRGYYLAIPLTLWIFGPEWLLGGAVAAVLLLFRFDHLRVFPDQVRDES